MEESVKVKPDKIQFDELMLKIRNGNIRIPDFQREFVWERTQIISLFDSRGQPLTNNKRSLCALA